MTPIRLTLAHLALSTLVACPVLAQQRVRYDQLAPAQASANSQPGVRRAPEHIDPVPTAEVSSQMQALIGGAYPPHFNADPKSPAEWKELIERRVAPTIAAIPALEERLGVSHEAKVIGGVKVFIVTPKVIPPQNVNRLLVHIHGGGYVFGPREGALPEALFMASFGGFRVISIDYRMPPDFPYPAAMDDAMAVWKEAVKMADPRNMAIFGTSTGGGMTLAMVLRARDEGLPLPAAIAPGTPWSDLTRTGDTYETNEWVDNVLVTWDGWLGRAARLYANGRDLKDPQLSPIYGDSIIYPQPTSGSDYIFRPVNNPGTGKYFSWPIGMVIDSVSGAIDVTKSQTGQRYDIGFIKSGTTDTCLSQLIIGGADGQRGSRGG